MKSNKLKISQCHAPCTRCKVRNDFLMFESGAGGNFETFVGDKTGNVYRVDMNKMHYLGMELGELLKPAIVIEDGVANIRNIPNEVKCKVCDSIAKMDTITCEGYVEVEAVEL
ncbi:hypothetical protein RI844_03035 [Thalassotalea fonticola]|uniref:Uncharacterized protein n=1 Tax=Thalassotalea fonticola TaxID=3065649 RepID=A0ABZ0GS19_9GAMM|nr:hypothetical protein RI844_03035 [Colwelliaceae bacterium S1-1]